MAENIKCPYCGSEYYELVERSRVITSQETTYRCLNCKKTFKYNPSNSVDAKFLCAFYYFEREKPGAEDLNSGDFTKIFKKSDGSLLFNTFYQEDLNMRAYSNYKKILNADLSNSSSYLQCTMDGYRRLFNVKKIILNKEFTQKALENPAMKVIWDDRYQGFILPENANRKLILDIDDWFVNELGFPKTEPHDWNAPKKSSGCYVATCAYGSYDCPEVWVLRRYRDNVLSQSVLGRTFINCYYTVSPVLVRMFGRYDWFKAVCRPWLDSFVENLKRKGFDDTPYTDK